MYKNKGFTLIELLVVIAIIGLLSSLAIISLNNARQRSRDAKRWSDIRTLQSAIELCVNESGLPPSLPGTWQGMLAIDCGGGTLFGEFLASSLMPTPPQGDTCTDAIGINEDCYMYCRESGTADYLIFTSYEGSPPPGGLDGLPNYDVSECVLHIDSAPTSIPDCDPTDGGTFCLGMLNT